MSFPLYPNTTAGLAAIGPVQAMSDRNEAQTYMANNGQMFASGGIASLAGGGLDSLPKYKFDPVTRKYILVDEEDTNTKPGLENLVANTRSSSSSKAEPSAWDLMSDKDKAAYYAANPTMAAITQLGQKAFGFTGLGALQNMLDPNFVRDQGLIARGIDPAVAFADRIGRLGTGYENVGGPGIYSGGVSYPGGVTGYQTGENGLPSELGGSAPPGSDATPSTPASSPSTDTPSVTAESLGYTGETYATGGIAALAGGGQSHLGDYSDGGRLLRGPGDGVSDSIPATIGNKRPARLADGEFVVPARIVSELGNGSTEAGARKLYEMMARIQKARSKTVGKDRVAVNSRADKNLPA